MLCIFSESYLPNATFNYGVHVIDPVSSARECVFMCTTALGVSVCVCVVLRWVCVCCV